VNSQQVSFRGVVKVEDGVDKQFDLSVTLDGNQADLTLNDTLGVYFIFYLKKKMFKFNLLYLNLVKPSSSCTDPDLDVSSCSITIPDSKFLFTTCNAPTITSISSLNVTYDTEIVITGKFEYF
jgi:hypothetical protein